LRNSSKEAHVALFFTKPEHKNASYTNNTRMTFQQCIAPGATQGSLPRFQNHSMRSNQINVKKKIYTFHCLCLQTDDISKLKIGLFLHQ
jgi:hypothetical protein